MALEPVHVASPALPRSAWPELVFLNPLIPLADPASAELQYKTVYLSRSMVEKVP